MSEIDWEAEADVWGEETREWAEAVSALWWEDWGSAEDMAYDTEEPHGKNTSCDTRP